MTLCFDYNRLCRRRGLQKKRDFADFQKLSMSRVELDINGLIGLIVRGDIRQLRELLNSKPELSDEREESSFNTPLHVASSRGFMPIVHLLVSRKVDMNAQDMYGNTALHYACDKGRKSIVVFLLENGSDPNIADHRGNTPIHNACSINDLSIVHVLLKHGAIGDHLDHANLKPADKASSSTIKLAIDNFLKSKREGGEEELGRKTVNWMGFGIGLGVGLGMAIAKAQDESKYKALSSSAQSSSSSNTASNAAIATVQKNRGKSGL